MTYYLPYKNTFIKIVRERDESDKVFVKRIKFIKEKIKSDTNVGDILLDSLCQKNIWLYNVSY
jgi:hypothetical protein